MKFIITIIAIVVVLLIYFLKNKYYCEKFENSYDIPLLQNYQDCIRKEICLPLINDNFTLSQPANINNLSNEMNRINTEYTTKYPSWMKNNTPLIDMTGRPVDISETEFPAKDRNGIQMLITLEKKYPFVDETYSAVKPLGQMTSVQFINVPTKLYKDSSNKLFIQIPDSINNTNVFYTTLKTNSNEPTIQLQIFKGNSSQLTLLTENDNLTNLNDNDNNSLLLTNDAKIINLDIKNTTNSILTLGSSPSITATFNLTDYLPGWNFIYGWIRKGISNLMMFVLKLRNTAVFTVRLPSIPNYKYEIGLVTEIADTPPSKEHFMNAQTFSVSRLLQDAIEAVYLAAPTEAPITPPTPEQIVSNVQTCPECPTCPKCPECPTCPVCPPPQVIVKAPPRKAPPRKAPKPAPRRRRKIIIPPRKRGGRARIVERFMMPFADENTNKPVGFDLWSENFAIY